MVGNIRRQSVDSVGDYEADEFEKEDLVQIAEPQKSNVRGVKGRNANNAGESHTNDTSASKAGGASDNTSLMREISIRNNKHAVSNESPNGGGA